uniref:Arachidonate 5-lipoxygenase-like n=1 Tax=Saccoglossus kowalevskii TaxID=10224 RepID=A0ABM0GUX6_SACKO|nr:PREDICTED: arachidonate 5-lipoxygenase-like [Saccoglossus kowalevskii]
MGNALKKADYIVKVKTGNLVGSGTDADVHIILYNESGQASKSIELDSSSNDFEHNHTSTLEVYDLPNFGGIATIEIWRDSWLGNHWYVDYVDVEDVVQKRVYPFPIQRWITRRHLKIDKYDSSLPQFAGHPEQRRNELDRELNKYQFVVVNEGLPPSAAKIPRAEQFSFQYKSTALAFNVISKLTAFLNGIVSSEWKALEDVHNIFGDHLQRPLNLEFWNQDWFFGAQRLMGCNPNQIRLCTGIPENFGVTNDMIGHLLDNMSLDEAISNKRLFIVDHKILDGITTLDPECVLCAPIGLFFMNKEDELMPVAIQLFQRKSDDNPVFLPTNAPYTWMLAKMYFNNADACIHECASQLLFTHLVLECFCVASHRRLSASHPIFRLLEPHYQFMITTTHLATSVLLDPGSLLDNLMTGGRKVAMEILLRSWKEWRFDVNGTLPKDMEARGVENQEVIFNYPYRDDAMLIYTAIKAYVTTIVQGHYDEPEKLTNDWEIQDWIKELVTPAPLGFGIKGIPITGDQFTNTNEVIEVITTTIFICSVGHAAVNFNQYDEYASPLRYPLFLRGQPPKSAQIELTESDILQHLPSKYIALETAVLSQTLSTHGTTSLGYFSELFQADPISIPALQKFRQTLKEIEKTIDIKNEERKAKYPYLHPTKLPNGIPI